MPDACERCFWLKLRLKHQMPFTIFPGIFSSIDSYTKNVVHGWFDKRGRPPWLSALGELRGYVEPPHTSKFRIHLPEFDIELSGAVDGIFVRADGSWIIVDYKTARFTGTQDELFPTYEIQLNAYEIIADRLGHPPVTGLALIYFEPPADKSAAHSDDVARPDGFVLPFSSNLLPVPLDRSKVVKLLGRARQIYDMPAPPPGHAECKDCKRLQKVMDEIARRGEA